MADGPTPLDIAAHIIERVPHLPPGGRIAVGLESAEEAEAVRKLLSAVELAHVDFIYPGGPVTLGSLGITKRG